MGSCKRFICYLLIAVFGFLYLKNLASFQSGEDSDCQAIAHIHHFKIGHSPKISSLQKAARDSGDDEDCHEGKIAMSWSPFPAAVYDIIPSEYEIKFDLVKNLKNCFESPVLAVPTPPPRIS